jgi:hypothetical protein
VRRCCDPHAPRAPPPPFSPPLSPGCAYPRHPIPCHPRQLCCACTAASCLCTACNSCCKCADTGTGAKLIYLFMMLMYVYAPCPRGGPAPSTHGVYDRLWCEACMWLLMTRCGVCPARGRGRPHQSRVGATGRPNASTFTLHVHGLYDRMWCGVYVRMCLCVCV